MDPRNKTGQAISNLLSDTHVDFLHCIDAINTLDNHVNATINCNKQDDTCKNRVF